MYNMHLLPRLEYESKSRAICVDYFLGIPLLDYAYDYEIRLTQRNCHE